MDFTGIDFISWILGGISGFLVAVAVRKSVRKLMISRDESDEVEDADVEEEMAEGEVAKAEPTEPGTSAEPIESEKTE